MATMAHRICFSQYSFFCAHKYLAGNVTLLQHCGNVFLSLCNFELFSLKHCDNVGATLQINTVSVWTYQQHCNIDTTLQINTVSVNILKKCCHYVPNFIKTLFFCRCVILSCSAYNIVCDKVGATSQINTVSVWTYQQHCNIDTTLQINTVSVNILNKYCHYVPNFIKTLCQRCHNLVGLLYKIQQNAVVTASESTK